MSSVGDNAALGACFRSLEMLFRAAEQILHRGAFCRVSGYSEGRANWCTRSLHLLRCLLQTRLQPTTTGDAAWFGCLHHQQHESAQSVRTRHIAAPLGAGYSRRSPLGQFLAVVVHSILLNFADRHRKYVAMPATAGNFFL